MEFNEKLQELRKQKGLTQEELAEVLYVSRTAISKWESGRGYPNIESLRAISKCFSVTLDELLSSDEMLTIAEEDSKQKAKHFRDLLFGLLDCSVVIFLFLPFFGQKVEGIVQEVPLSLLATIEPYVKVSYFVIIIGMVLWGTLTLAFQNCQRAFWVRSKGKVSLGLSVVGALIFMMSSQPYAAVFIFMFLIIKALTLIKWA